MKNTFVWAWASLFLALGFGLPAQAQEALPPGTFATVNKVPLPSRLVDQVLRNNAAQGAPDTPELRKLVRGELIGRAALSQEAMQMGLDKTEAAQAQMELLKQNYLADALITAHLQKNPIEDSAIRAEYERQVSMLKGAKEYRIKDIVLADETTANAVIVALKKGDVFDKLAREKSIDPSKVNGGDMGWILAAQLNPMIANVVVNLAKGQLTAAPIQVQNVWHVLQLEDLRQFVPPPFDDAKAQVLQGLQVQQRKDYINKVIGAARIQVAD